MRRPSILFLVVFCSGVVLDRITKVAAWRWLPQMITGNQQGVFGLIPQYWSVVGLVGLLAWLGFSQNWSVGLALILAGGVSNLVDRILWGQVIDFLSLGPLPIFNLADVLLGGGVLLVLYQELFSKRKEHETKNLV